MLSIEASLSGRGASPSAEPLSGFWSLALRTAVLLCLAGAAYVSVIRHSFNPLFQYAETHPWARCIERPSLLWALMGFSLWGFRILLWFRYKPHLPAPLEDAPHMTVVIPAYNEGAMVEKTIDSAAAASYPEGRLEIFVVDDGSRDDTWSYIERAAQRYPDRVTPVRFAVNRGKRAALEEGFRRARGEVVATIDSDSVIDSDTLLAIAGPFRDARVGAVAGKVVVYNREQGIIPRMLQVRFILAFDLMRAVQSTYRTVYCCPGALSAYRTTVVREVLDSWVAQKFLGSPCTYGEDRALTNFVLGKGYDAVYQRTARVHTMVPRTYDKLCRMFLRWDRSYIREELHFARIVWKRPWKLRAAALADTLITDLRYPVMWASMALLIIGGWHDPATLLRMFIVMGVVAAMNMFYYLHSEPSWDFVFGIVYAYYAFFGLFWIFPYALFTVRSQSWLTR